MGNAYWELFNSVIPLYIIIVIGWLSSYLKLVKPDGTTIEVINGFVSNVCIPVMVLQYLAQVDLRDIDYWKYAAAFLLVHFPLGILSMIGTLVTGYCKNSSLRCDYHPKLRQPHHVIVTTIIITIIMT